MTKSIDKDENSSLLTKEILSNPSGFVQKLYQMVNCASDEIISVREAENSSFS